MSRRRSLSEEERALWSGFARSIEPLRRRAGKAEAAADEQPATKVRERAEPRRQQTPPARQEERQEQRQKERREERQAQPSLAPLGRRLRARVARGREQIDARLDLHGFTLAAAHAELLRFLARAQADGARFALVVTGKGRGAGVEQRERGVLKRQVPAWLSLPEFRPFVVGFEDAHAAHGGQGALYVRLRRVRAPTKR
jgi:DNA-nicking Smr family endonuclease